ncbi:MAG: alanine--glyoxylate aminotransferase family protein [Planctomycetaceae bacterium]|nr:MAG: alanine--glyoxylate aminotransferase family protein [Planctomycetaceae bacterium]
MHLMIKQRLFTPGPTDVPPEVLTEMSKPMFHHRTQRFKDMFAQVNDGMKKVLMTTNDVLTLAGSGTAGMEAAISCAVPRDKKVLIANNGKFAERWVKVAKLYGLQIDEVKQDWGTAISPELVKQKVATGEYGAVIVVHSETSAATACDLAAIGAAVKGSDAILIADCITSAGVLPLRTDEWGVDIVAAGSQKALMLPPGLAFVAVSPKAWAVIDKIASPTMYLNLKAYKKSLADNDVPYTPAVSLIRGAKVVVDMLNTIGIEKIWARAAVLAKASREAAKAMGMEIFSKQPSDSVTGIMYPAGIEDKKFRKVLREKYGCSVAGGQDALDGKMFRISHMGYVDPVDTIGLVAAIEFVLADSGVKVEIGKGVAAAAKVLKDWA